MTDEQCQVLIESIKKLTESVFIASNSISDALYNLPVTSVRGIEYRLDRLISIIEDIEYERCLDGGN